MQICLQLQNPRKINQSENNHIHNYIVKLRDRKRKLKRRRDDQGGNERKRL